MSAGCRFVAACLPVVHVLTWRPACLACIQKKPSEAWQKLTELKCGKTKTCPSIPVSVSMCLCGCPCVCVYLCVAVQKMAEAHMQKLGVYPPFEDPCEGEEDEDYLKGEEGEDAAPAKAAGEREVLFQMSGTAITTLWQRGRRCLFLKGKIHLEGL